MNSFHFCAMYLSSSITEFQHATWPIRSLKLPPSRTAPAFYTSLPNGFMMSFSAGLPSIQNAHSYGSICAFAVDSTAE